MSALPDYNSTKGYQALQDSQEKLIPQTEVGGEIEKLTTQCVQLDKQLEELASRLVPVLALPKDAAGAQTSAPEPARVPLAQILHERVAHLSILSDRLQSIINRIEV